MTVTSVDAGQPRFTIDISAESLDKTAGLAEPGAVNLEKALREKWPEVEFVSWETFGSTHAENEREVPVQVNGKLRDRVTVPVGIAEAELERLVLARPKVVAALDGKRPLKVIHAGGKLVNIVVR